MRFKIVLETISGQNVLPINYQYELAGWIYKVLEKGDKVFAEWLHSKGYRSGEQYFKFFTFSHLIIPRSAGKILKDRILLNAGEINFYISFLPEKATKSFISGLFKDTVCEIYNKSFQASFRVRNIEMNTRPEFRPVMQFKLLSPVVVSKPVDYKGKLQHEYLAPEHPEYTKYLIQNLWRKYMARYDEMQKGGNFVANQTIPVRLLDSTTAKIKFKLLNDVRKKGIMIKSSGSRPVKVIGYLYSFEMDAPVEILETAYYGGFGEVCSMGFGFGEVL
jgi:CRISPR-associated endoribonuclease Cas6